jgi:hypothetical protein
MLVVLVAFTIGFRPSSNLTSWLAVIGIYVLLLFAIFWVSTALGGLCVALSPSSWWCLPSCRFEGVGSV